MSCIICNDLLRFCLDIDKGWADPRIRRHVCSGDSPPLRTARRALNFFDPFLACETPKAPEAAAWAEAATQASAAGVPSLAAIFPPPCSPRPRSCLRPLVPGGAPSQSSTRPCLLSDLCTARTALHVATWRTEGVRVLQGLVLELLRLRHNDGRDIHMAVPVGSHGCSPLAGFHKADPGRLDLRRTAGPETCADSCYNADTHAGQVLSAFAREAFHLFSAPCRISSCPGRCSQRTHKKVDAARGGAHVCHSPP